MKLPFLYQVKCNTVHYANVKITIFVPGEVQYSSLCKCKNYHFLYQVKCNTVHYANVKITIFLYKVLRLHILQSNNSIEISSLSEFDQHWSAKYVQTLYNNSRLAIYYPNYGDGLLLHISGTLNGTVQFV